jgi:hypothetical protein
MNLHKLVYNPVMYLHTAF